MFNKMLMRMAAGLAVAFCVIASDAQAPRAANVPLLDAKSYETQQRARRLLQMEAEIKTLPDVEVRCQLRFNILEFVYSKDARSEYGNAEPILTAFFEDMAANEKQFASRAKYWRNDMALLLRKHAPETAERIEAKYV